MGDICEFRTAKLVYGTDNITFVVEASIEQGWDTLSFPVYLDRETVMTLPTVKRILAKVRRRYQAESPLHAALDGSPLTLEFQSGGETHQFTQARVVEWKVYGKLDGEMTEEVALVCEGEV